MGKKTGSKAQYGKKTRATTRFFLMGGIIASVEGASLMGNLRKIFKFGGSETLFSVLVMRYVSKKLTSDKCEKAGVFIHKCLFPRSC